MCKRRQCLVVLWGRRCQIVFEAVVPFLQMGLVNSIAESLCECLFKPMRQDFEAKTRDLDERLARMELITKRFHLQPGGLPGQQFFACCPDSRSRAPLPYDYNQL